VYPTRRRSTCGIRSGFSELEAEQGGSVQVDADCAASAADSRSLRRYISTDGEYKETRGIRSGFSELEAAVDRDAAPLPPERHPQRILGA